VAAPGLAQAPLATPVVNASVPSSTLRDEDFRVAAIAYRLGRLGLFHCPRTLPITGMLMHHLPEYQPADRRLMIDLYGLDRGPGILLVLPDSPAARAGLVAGDVLLSVNGKTFPSPSEMAAQRDPDKWRNEVEAAELLLEEELGRGPARLQVLRKGSELALELGSLPACPIRIRLARSSQVNAFANDYQVILTTALLGFAQSDDELALIIGHELSHFILNHPPMHTSDKLLASIGIRSQTFWNREAAADRLGIRLMAAAGYNLDAIIPFWRRFLGKYDGPQIFRYHPSLGARERITREEIAAIRAEASSPR
jgi:hypothetical protein